MQTIKYKETNLRFKDEGSGKAIVLLHGYLESLEIWGDFASILAKEYRVLSIDLLGHGESGNDGEANTMEKMAEAVKFILDELKVDKCHMIGHSMGGYVVMNFVEFFPNVLYTYCLFHSTANADTPKKVIHRQKEIQLIKAGKKVLLIRRNIPMAFAKENHSQFKSQIEICKNIAVNNRSEGIIACLKGMKMRVARNHVLKNSNIPAMVILGENDNYIPFGIVFDILNNDFPNLKVNVLKNSGHMGFIEEKDKSIELIKDFLKKIL